MYKRQVVQRNSLFGIFLSSRPATIDPSSILKNSLLPSHPLNDLPSKRLIEPACLGAVQQPVTRVATIKMVMDLIGSEYCHSAWPSASRISFANLNATLRNHLKCSQHQRRSKLSFFWCLRKKQDSEHPERANLL